MSADLSNTSRAESPIQPLNALKAPSLRDIPVSDLLSRPLPRRIYLDLFKSQPNRIPEGIELPNRRRPALEKSLANAFEQRDPVRQLIVFVRSYALYKSGPEYAEDLGIKQHTLSKLEERGFDPERSVASSYMVFLRDWERRAREDNNAAPFFRWAQQRLERLLVGHERGTPLGLLVKWQNQVGSPAFTTASGISPAMLSGYRTLHKNISFSELVQVGEGLGYNPARRHTADAWNAPWMKEVRRVFFHHSMKLGRSASATKVHMALGWAGTEMTEAGIRRAVPALTEAEATQIARFDSISPRVLSKIREVRGISKALPKEELTSLEAVLAREAKGRSKMPGSISLAVECMRSQHFSTKTVAKLAEIYDGGKPREGTEIVRSVIFEKRFSEKLPWGVVAALLSKDSNTFTRLISLRAEELCNEYRRKTAHPMQPAALYRRIWGRDVEPDQKAVSLLDGVRHGAADAILKRLLHPLIHGAPELVVSEIVQLRGSQPVWSRAASSESRLTAIIGKQLVPSLPEYTRILKAGRITPNITHEIGWRDAWGSQVRAKGGRSPFGVVQRRIIKMMLAEESGSRSAFMKKHQLKAGAEAQGFQALETRGEIPLVVMKRILAIAGLTNESPRSETIKLLLVEKEYPAAISKWYRAGMNGLTETQKQDVLHLLEVGPGISQEGILCVNASGADLLTLSHRLRSGKIEKCSPSWKRTVEGVLSVMRLFPGVTISEIREVFSKDGKIVWGFSQPSSIHASWVPGFEHYTDRILKGQGIIDSPTMASTFIPTHIQGWRARVVALFGPDAMKCASLFKVLFPADGAAIYGESGEVLQVLRGIISEGIRYINLERAAKEELIAAFQEIWKVSQRPVDCRIVVGAALARQVKAEGGQLRVLSVGHALDRFLTFLVFGERKEDSV